MSIRTDGEGGDLTPQQAARLYRMLATTLGVMDAIERSTADPAELRPLLRECGAQGRALMKQLRQLFEANETSASCR